MIIAIGTKNKAKVQALQQVLEESAYFQETQLLSYPADSEVSEQPMSLAEAIQGAKNRAFNAYNLSGGVADYSFGIESGLMEAPGSKTGFFNVCVCCIYNGQDYATGLSTGFEIPLAVLHFVTEHEYYLSKACIAAGISSNENLGEEEGLIGILTQGKTTRLEYTKESIYTALIQIMNPQLYGFRDLYISSQ